MMRERTTLKPGAHCQSISALNGLRYDCVVNRTRTGYKIHFDEDGSEAHVKFDQVRSTVKKLVVKKVAASIDYETCDNLVAEILEMELMMLRSQREFETNG